MGEFYLASPWQETVENGGDLALQHQLTVDELYFLPGHLGCADTSSFLGAIRSRAIVLKLVVV
jgi:hypothetical protein